MVWLLAGCTGGTASLETSTSTVPVSSTTSSSSTTTTTVVDSEAILSGFLAAVNDSDASGAFDMVVTIDADGVSLATTGSSRASGGDSHVVMESAFADVQSEVLTVDGEVFARDEGGPWIVVDGASLDGGDAVAGSGSDTLAFLGTLSSVEYLGPEIVDGVELHRLATPSEFEFDATLLGLDVPADDISGFEQSFLVDDDGHPVRWDLRFEAETYNAMLGRVADTTFVLEALFHDWGEDQNIEAPDTYSVWHESERFAYRVAYPSTWDVVEELADADGYPMDVFYARSGDEIQVYIYTLDEPSVEPLNAWLGAWRDDTIEYWEGVFGDTVYDVEVAGRSSPVQEFQFTNRRVWHGFYTVAQLSPDTVHEFIWYSSAGIKDGDLERFTDFLSSVAPAGSTAVLLDSLPVGACFDDPTEFDSVGYVAQIPCEEPHDNELFAVLEMPQEDWPGGSAVEEWAVEACDAKFVSYTGEISDESSVDWMALFPLQERWEAGDRSVHCFLWDRELNKLVGSMAQDLEA